MEILLLGVLSMLTLAIGVVSFVIFYQRRVIAHQAEVEQINKQKEWELIQASIEGEEEERTRIAAELHDDVNATLASARLYLYKEKANPYSVERIDKAKDLLDEGMSRIREISHKLQPASLQHLGLERSLEALMETLARSERLRAEYTAEAELPRMAENVELAIYRISQELFTNIIKHSGASFITLNTETINGQATFTFIHDGNGLTQELFEKMVYKKGSIGLKNIVSRLKLINAELQFRKEGTNYETLLILH